MDANLKVASLINADIGQANFTGADVTGANFNGVRCHTWTTYTGLDGSTSTAWCK
nr:MULTISPECIES: pentapeptide repeat-containing protein [Microcystis]